MTREEFIELSKTALAPALKGRRRPDGTVKIFYSKGGPSCIIPADVFGFQPCDTCGVAVVVGVDSGSQRDGAEPDFLGDPVREYRAGLARGDLLALGVLVIEANKKRDFLHDVQSFSLGLRVYSLVLTLYNINKYFK